MPGNDAEALSRVPVTNDTPDTTSPDCEQSGHQFEPGIGPGLCGGGRDRGDGDDSSETVEVEGDAAVETER